VKGRALLLALLAALLVAAPRAARAVEVHLFAAASLREPLDELADGYEKARPGVKVVRNYGASGTLAQQVEAGAPADLFVSASARWMDRLREGRRVEEGSVFPFARNVLVFAGRTGTKAASMKDLPALGRISLGSPGSVPAGEYATQALQRAGVAEALLKKLVLARDVREALLYAERGEVDGAFVYRTDALRAKEARELFAVPPELHDPVVYPAALTRAGAKKAEARGFFDLLRTGAARAVLKRHGFAVD
jgi:molybdate transport system substrate-binding protein